MSAEPLTREALSRPGVEVLRRGAGRKSDLLRLDAGGEDRVVKDFAARGRFARRMGAWLVERELRAYEQLDGHPSVPRSARRIDAHAFAVEYRPGQIMGPRLAGQVPAGFVAALRQAVVDMHARGVVHLDLRHRSNVLATSEGDPVLIDFASALCFRPGGLGHRLVMPLLAWIDRRAVEKWAGQLAQGASDAQG